MEQRTAYRSAFRNQRAPAKAPKPAGVKSISSPVGAGNSTTAYDQSRALRTPQGQRTAPSNPAMRPAMPLQQDELPSMLAFTQLAQPAQQAFRGAYGQAGFEGVQRVAGDDWWDLPDAIRVQLLEGSRR